MAWIRKIPQRWLFITAIASVVAVAGGIGYNLYQFFLADEIQRSITGVQVPLEHASSPYPLIETLVAAKAEAAFQDAEAGNSEIKAFHAELEGRFRRLRVDLPGICREAVLEDGWQAQLADRGLQTDLAAGLLCRADDEALRTIDPGPEGLRLEAVTVSLADPDAPPSVEMTTFVFRDKSLPSEQEAWLVVPATLVPQAGTNGAAVLPPRLTRSLLWTVVAGRTLVTEGAALASARKEQAERLTSFYFMDLNGILYFQNPDLWLTVREFAQELGRSPLVTLSLYSRSIRKNVGYRRTLPYLDSAGRGSVVSHFSFLSFSAPSGLPLGGLLAVDEQVEEASDRMAELVLWPARQAGPLRRYSSLTLACPDNQESVIEEPEYDGLRVVEDGGLHAIACAAGKDTKTRIDRFSRLSSLFLKRTESVFQELKVPKDEVVLDATPTGATHRLITIPLGDKRIQCFLFPLAEPRYAVWLKVALPWAVPLLLLFVLLFILIKMQKSLRSTIRERDRTVAERNRALADTRDLVTSIPGGWFITDAAGTILDTNTQFQEMTGRTAIQRPNILDIVSADQHIVFTAKMQASRDLEVMLNLRHTDGSEHLTIFKRRPLAGGDGVRDDQRDVWIALDTQRTDDLVVDRFLQHIAHTLKSPVHSLTLLSDRISESTDPKEQEHDRWLFKNELHRFETRMKTLWVLSDLETGKLRASPRRTSLVKMLYDTIRGFIPLAEQHGIALRQELARTKLPRRVVTDQNIVFVVLSNLLDNALKYTPQGGTVWVHALPGEGGGWWRLIVRDTGYGMAKAEIDNVFVRGARSLRDEIKKQEGFGLGMYVVHRLTTEYLQGRIAVASPGEGRGTTITVDLPFSPAGT